MGIHARPAGTLVKAVKDFKSVVLVEHDGKTAGGTKLIAMISLGIRFNDVITITVAGPDEDIAVVAMEKFSCNICLDIFRPVRIDICAEECDALLERLKPYLVEE